MADGGIALMHRVTRVKRSRRISPHVSDDATGSPRVAPTPYPQALAYALAAHAAHARARARTPARTLHYAALPRFPHAQIPSRSDSLTLRFRARGCRGMPQAGME